MDIRYIGTKAYQADRLFGTGLIWNGKDDVQTVDDESVARRMVSACPDVYEQVKEAPATPARAPFPVPESDLDLKFELNDGTSKTLRAMSRAQLLSVARRQGMQVRRDIKVPELLREIIDVHRAAHPPAAPALGAAAVADYLRGLSVPELLALFEMAGIDFGLTRGDETSTEPEPANEGDQPNEGVQA